MTKTLFGIVLALSFSVPAGAGLISSVIPEFSGNFEDPSDPSITYPLPSITIGDFTYTIPTGITILGATISGTFGNDDVANTTALSDYFVDGGTIKVAGCDSTSAPCFNNDINLPPTPWTYTFTKAQLSALSSGSLDFTVVQTGPFSIQTGPTELDILVSPEPASILLFGCGLAAIAFRRRA